MCLTLVALSILIITYTRICNSGTKDCVFKAPLLRTGELEFLRTWVET